MKLVPKVLHSSKVEPSFCTDRLRATAECLERYQHMQELILDLEALSKNSAYSFRKSRNMACEALGAAPDSGFGDSLLYRIMNSRERALLSKNR